MSDLAVLITCRQMQNVLDEFRGRFTERGIAITTPAVTQHPTEDELIEIIGGFDGMIAGDDPLSARVLEHAKRMRIISKWGVGTDGIDREAADRLGIKVTNTPNVFGDEVADLAAGFLVMLARQLHRVDASVRDGGWLKVEGRSLNGLALGIVGFGDVGEAVARRGAGFGMTVRAHDVVDEAIERARQAGVEVTPLEEMLLVSDYVVLCCPLTPQTHHLLNRETLAAMKQGASVINVARGPVIDEPALVDALESGQIAAAALDVFEEEPLPGESPLRAFEQCIFGAHNGSNTHEAVLRASDRAVANLLEGLK